MKRIWVVIFAVALLCGAVVIWVAAGDAWWQLRQAEAAYLKRDYPAASVALNAAIIRSEQSYLPRTLRPRKMLAHALIEQGKLDEATLEWKKILLFDSNDHTANFALGMMAWQNRRFVEAEPKLTIAQACMCPNAEIYRKALVALRDAKAIELDAKRIAAEVDEKMKKIVEDIMSEAWLLLIPKVGWVVKGVAVAKGAWKAGWAYFKRSPESVALEHRLAAAVKLQEESWKAFLASPL